jgi:phospholipid/cholesterol/gamma-HCH transport system ATP-binding protein
MTNALIEVKGLHTQFGTQIIHKDLNLSINEGEVIGIVGGSGSGKSVLMRYMIGLEKPQAGKIIYHTSPPYPSTQVGVLFQFGALISSLSALENIMAPLTEVAHLSPDLAAEIAHAKIEMVGLPSLAGRKYPSELSGGMIKRIALARALALDPEILFLDEPTSGLDPIGAGEFDMLIKDLQKELQITVIMITHDLDTLVEVCDRVAVLIDHKVTIGRPDEVSKIDHPWIQNYFHGPRGKRLFA